MVGPFLSASRGVTFYITGRQQSAIKSRSLRVKLTDGGRNGAGVRLCEIGRRKGKPLAYDRSVRGPSRLRHAQVEI